MPLNQALHSLAGVLEAERQALAALDLERILVCARGKEDLAGQLARYRSDTLDDECKGLLDAVRRLNAINRKMRNLIAANIQARLGELTGTVELYGAAARGTSRLPKGVWHEA